MRSSASSLSRFLSITSVALATILWGACGDDGSGECGVGDAPATLGGTIGTTAVTYETLTSLAGNDCPDTVTPAPAGVVSVTIEGAVAADRQQGLITFCIPRPDMGNGSHIISSTDPFGIRLIDLSYQVDVYCSYHIDSANRPTGTIVGSGVCDNAENEAGFALDITASGTLVGDTSNESSCAASLPLAMQGNVAVTKRMQ